MKLVSKVQKNQKQKQIDRMNNISKIINFNEKYEV